MKQVGYPYFVGTEVQEKSGRVKVKVSSGDDGAKWIGRNRRNFMNHHKRELEDSERVFHVNGDKADDRWENLVAIKFTGVKYALKTSRVVYTPKRPAALKEFIPKHRRVLAVA